jgi:hypothetical protein
MTRNFKRKGLQEVLVVEGGITKFLTETKFEGMDSNELSADWAQLLIFVNTVLIPRV